MAEYNSDQTIVDRVKILGITEPDTPAFIFWGSSGQYVLSRGDILDLSSKFAYRLTQRGILPGDVVCISLPNSPERVVIDLGVQLAGAVSMNGQVLRADGKDLVESMDRAQCKLLVVDRHQKDGAWKVLKEYFEIRAMENNLITVQSDSIKSMSQIEQCTIDRNTNEFLEGLKSEKSYVYSHSSAKDLALIFTTSGSSGYTKLVKHTHENLLRTGLAYTKLTQISAPEKFYLSSPLGWMGGYPSHYLYSGCPRVLMDVSAAGISNLPLFIWDVICKENVSTASLLPAHIDILHTLAKEEGLGGWKLKKVVTGGQPLKMNNLSSIGLLTDSFQIGYGATELGFIATMNVTEETVKSFQDCMAGYPFPWVETKIEEDNRNVTSTGEILIKSETLCTGYVDGQNVADAFMPGGWFRTGDVGYIRDDGCVVVEGRSNNAIMHGAYILYPSWLEKKLVNCPGVKQVVVVPVPDPVLHHEICLCVQTEEDANLSEEDVINFSRKQLALDEESQLNVSPRYVVFFEQFPLTVTEKLDRTSLTKEATLKLGL